MNKNKKIKKIVIVIFSSLLGIAILVGIAYSVLVYVGEKNIRKNTDNKQLELLYETMKNPDLIDDEHSDDLGTIVEPINEFEAEETEEIEETEETEEEKAIIWKEGYINYNNKIYNYNEDIMTFLFMGIDSRTVVTPAKDGISGGQSDAMFLLVINPDTKKISIVGINRDTITDIDFYDRSGNYVMTDKRQLTLQHGYGDGMHLSCERSVNAVSKLFYNIPIQGYCSLNLGGLEKLNDAVGGVEVITPNNVQILDDLYNTGDHITLFGENIEWFLKRRNVNEFNSAGERLERQKVYLSAYLDKAFTKIKETPSFSKEIYDLLTSYMVTNVSLDSIVYLASEATNYSFNSTQIYSLQGETFRGVTFEEFYPNKPALYDMVIKLFYEEVTE